MSKNSKRISVEDMRMRASVRKFQRGDELSIKKAKNIFASIVLLVQLILSVVFIAYVDELDALPMKYFSVVFAVLMFFFVLVMLLQFFKKTHILGKVFGVIVCVVLAVGVYYLHETMETMKTLEEGGKYTTNEFSVAVLKDSHIEEITGLKGKTIGVMTSYDNTVRDKALVQVQEKVGEALNVVEYENALSLILALEDGKIDCAIYKNSYDSILVETVEGFSEKVKVIDTVIVQEKIIIDKDEPATVPEGGITMKPFVVYLSGIDMEGKISRPGRSDVNILVFVNPLTKKILMVSTPRDYYVSMPGLTPDGMGDKLTHAGNEGVEASIATLENLYGIDVDYFAKVNFTSFVGIIDILGEVSVYSEYDFVTSGGNTVPNLKFTKGYNTITSGEEALSFARERYNLPGGDVQRGKNQMAMVKAVIQKMLSPAILSKYLDILDASSSIVQTNMPTEAITQLVKMQLEENCSWDIEMKWATGTGGAAVCYQASSYGPLSVIIPDQEVVAELSYYIEAFMDEE